MAESKIIKWIKINNAIDELFLEVFTCSLTNA